VCVSQSRNDEVQCQELCGCQHEHDDGGGFRDSRDSSMPLVGVGVTASRDGGRRDPDFNRAIAMRLMKFSNVALSASLQLRFGNSSTLTLCRSSSRTNCWCSVSVVACARLSSSLANRARSNLFPICGHGKVKVNECGTKADERMLAMIEKRRHLPF
jgi:hypothetical protein